jgi:hypothetical protein
MTDATVNLAVKQIAVEAIVMRAVPCDIHDEYVAECPDCLTGERAHELGLAPVEDLGTVAHYHADERQQADQGQLSRGIRFWRK